MKKLYGLVALIISVTALFAYAAVFLGTPGADTITGNDSERLDQGL
jgi:hypothetical protein